MVGWNRGGRQTSSREEDLSELEATRLEPGVADSHQAVLLCWLFENDQ